MLFFDFKIILILSLSIVIYFIYREIEFMHLRISTLEYTTQHKQMNDMCPFDVTKFMPVVTIVPPTKNIVVDTSETKPDINYIINNKVTNLQTISDNSPKFVEIYSNDNSSPVLDDNNNDNIDLELSSPDNTGNVENNTQANDVNEPINDVIELHSISQSPKKTMHVDIDFNYKSDNEVVYTEEQLKNMKLLDLSNIATKCNIQLTKSVNGVVKKKLKQDLINEIISKKNI
jgi:hypothetical protein